jgi:hypothetical protein
LEQIHAQTGVQLNPFIWKKQWDEYSHHKQQERLLRGQAKGKAMSNPMDFYETYANWGGLKRLARVGWHGRGEKVAKELEEADKELVAAQSLMTSGKWNDTQASAAALNGQLDQLDNDTVSGATLSMVSANVAAAIADHKKKATSFGQEAKALEKGDESDESIAEARASQAREQALVDGLTKMQNNIRLQTAFAGPDGAVDMGDVTAGLDPALSAEFLDTDKIKSQILEKVKAVNDELANDKQARLQLHVDAAPGDPAGDAEIAKVLAEKVAAKTKKEHILTEVRRPEFYYARLARTAAEAEEQKKLATIDDAEELKRLLANAIHEHNPAKTGAILKKLAKDSNFNEVLDGEDLDHKPIQANAAGMRKYFEKIQKQTNMSDTHMFQLASEVAYINEGENWWDLARVTKVTPTGMDWSDPDDDHQKQIFTEMSKRNYRTQAANFARLSYVQQERVPETGGWKTIGLTRAGRGLLKQAGENKGAITEFERNLRPNTAAAIMSYEDWEETLKKDGVNPRLIDIIKKSGGEKGGVVNLDDFQFGPTQHD